MRRFLPARPQKAGAIMEELSKREEIGMEFAAGEAALREGMLQTRARRETEVLLEQKVRERRKAKPLFYALCCGGTALFAVFGLFAGMRLPYSAAAMAVAGRDTMMGSSLFGMAAELLRGSLPQADSLYTALLQLFLLLMTGAAAFGLASCILAFAAGRTARRLMSLSSTLVLLTFGSFSALVFLGAETMHEALAHDALFTAAAVLVLRILSAAVQWRGKGLGNALLLLFAAAAFTGLCLPQTPLKTELAAALLAPVQLWGPKDIALALLLAVTAANLLLSILRLGAGKAFLFDLIRFLAQCAAAGSAFAVCAAEEMSFSLFTGAPLPSLLVGLAALCGLVLSAALLAIRSAQKRPAEKKAASKGQKNASKVQIVSKAQAASKAAARPETPLRAEQDGHETG